MGAQRSGGEAEQLSRSNFTEQFHEALSLSDFTEQLSRRGDQPGGLWQAEGLDLKLSTYGCISTGDEVGPWTLLLSRVSATLVAKTLPFPCVFTAFVAETPPLSCVSTASVPKALPLSRILAGRDDRGCVELRHHRQHW